VILGKEPYKIQKIMIHKKRDHAIPFYDLTSDLFNYYFNPIV
jgi:hypothetical protein